MSSAVAMLNFYGIREISSFKELSMVVHCERAAIRLILFLMMSRILCSRRLHSFSSPTPLYKQTYTLIQFIHCQSTGQCQHEHCRGEKIKTIMHVNEYKCMGK